MYGIKCRAPLGRRVTLLSTALALALFAAAPGRAEAPRAQVRAFPAGAPGRIAQDDESPDDEDTTVPSDQVEKYIAVYVAMQRDHSLTVEQAAGKQGLSVSEFRALEDKIEESPVAHERVMDALKAAATGKKPSQSHDE